MFGDVEYLPQGGYGPLMGIYYQLLLLQSGRLKVTMGWRSFELPVGSMVLLKPGNRIRLQFSRKSRTRHSWCTVHPDAIPASLKILLDRSNGPAPIPRSLQGLMETAFSTARISSAEVEGLRHHLGIALLHHYLCCCEKTKPKGASRSNAVDRAIDYVRSHYQDPLTVASLARAGGVTPTHLNKLFRDYLDTTPARYLWEVRTERGADLLLETSLTIAEAAYRAGFQNPFHFSRLIRKRYHMSPRKFRSRKWDKIL
jgi:AraC-like DNA-binding protein